MFDHRRFYASSTDVGLSNGNLSIIVLKHHGVKRDFAALFILETVDEDLLILGYLELLSCDFYNCVHFIMCIITSISILLPYGWWLYSAETNCKSTTFSLFGQMDFSDLVVGR